MRLGLGFFTIALLCINFTLYAQDYKVRGKVTDAANGQLLSFANVRIENTSKGAAANVNGVYELQLKAGNYTLIASYLGYNSDTLTVSLNTNLTVDFDLEPAVIQYDEITVLPGVNPAIALIEKAIERKEKRNKFLNSYFFNAYTKGIIKTANDIVTGENKVDVGFGGDSLKITGIVENESKGYFKKPSFYKEEIIAQKQTANIPSSLNIITGGRIIQNFYSDDIQFFGHELTGPLADNALDFYNFFIEDTLAINDKTIFQLYFSPYDEDEPGFYGRIFISDKSYDLVKVDLYLTDAANPGQIFTKINIFQQFVPYEDSVYMPIDYRLFIEADYLGLVKFGMELNSILYDYVINPELNDDFFDMVVLKVLPEADKKDSVYWKDVQTIPETTDERNAYRRIDSLESIPKTFWDRFSLLSSSFAVNDFASITGPLGLYHFNRVEGHSIDFDVDLYNLSNKRWNSELSSSYGFADERFKGSLSTTYLLGDYRTHSVSVNLFDKTAVLFSDADRYNNLTSTLTSLFGKYDFRNYYRTRGFGFEIEHQTFPVLGFMLNFTNRTDNSLIVNTDFSFLNKDKKYNNNKPVTETRLNLLKFGFELDFRKYIEDGYRRRRITQGSYFLTAGDVILSGKSLLNSESDFEIFSLRFFGMVNSFNSTSFDFMIRTSYSNDALPYQLNTALPGNINAAGKFNSFRTLRFGEVFGSKVAQLYFNYNFNNLIWRWLSIPLLKDSQISLTSYVNCAYVDLKDNMQITDINKFKKPFFEAGFGIGHPLFPFNLEFTWKLNHLDKNNFVLGINTFAL